MTATVRQLEALQRDKLIQELKKYKKDRAEYDIKSYKDKELAKKTAKEILQKFSFGPSIKRAFHDETPSKRYEGWRWYGKPDELIEKLETLRSKDDFDPFAYELGDSLVKDWVPKKNTTGKLSIMKIGVAMKITNLVLKHLSFSKNCENKSLRALLHVPWDSYTLSPLKKIWKENGNPPLPYSPSQGSVTTLDMYEKLHKLISGITEEAKVDRIVYEFFAWHGPRANP